MEKRKKARRTNPFRIEQLQGDPSCIGVVEMESRRIVLHKNNESIAKLLRDGPEQTLLFVAASLLCNRLEKQGHLSFPETTGKMLAMILAGDAAKLVGKGKR